MTNEEGLRDLHKVITQTAKIFAESNRGFWETQDTEMRERLLKIMRCAASAISVASDSVDDIEDVQTGGTPADGQQVCYCG